MLLNSQVPPKAHCANGLRSCDARDEARGTERVEHVNALTPTLTYRIQAELTQSQAEGTEKGQIRVSSYKYQPNLISDFMYGTTSPFRSIHHLCPWTTRTGLHEGQRLLGRGLGIPITAMPAKSRLPGRLGHSESIGGFSCSFWLAPGFELITHGPQEHLAQP